MEKLVWKEGCDSLIKCLRNIMESGGVYDLTLSYICSCIKRVLQGQKDITLKFKHRSGQLKIKCYGNVKDREFKTAEMLITAFEQIHYDLDHDLHMDISCHDLCRVKNRHMYAYCKRHDSQNITTIPDYNFIDWKEQGIYDYEVLREAMMEASRKQPEYDKLFWIGNIKNSDIRKKLYMLGKSDKRMEIIASNLNAGGGVCIAGGSNKI